MFLRHHGVKQRVVVAVANGSASRVSVVRIVGELWEVVQGLWVQALLRLVLLSGREANALLGTALSEDSQLSPSHNA
jgi:hypothetical protein